MAIFFLLLIAHISCASLHAQNGADPATRPAEPQPLAGTISVSGLEIKQSKLGVWTADFDYFFTGEPPSAALAIELTPQPGSPLGPSGLEQYQTFLRRPERGAHHVTVEIRYPGGQQRTLKIAATIRSQMFGTHVVATQQVDKVID